MKSSASSAHAVRIGRKRKPISPGANVRYVKFSAEEMAIDANDFDASLPSEMFRRTDAEKATLRRSVFVVCIAVGGHEGKINVGKIYRVAKPLKKDVPQWLRVINEHGEAARYPIGWFVPVALPALAQRALAASKAA